MVTIDLLIFSENSLSTILAYIDPGSGSAIMSAIIGFAVAIGLAIKTYWYKIKRIFTGTKVDETDIADEPSNPSQEPKNNDA